MDDIKWTLSIRVAERKDGGMRVWSDDMPGFILSGNDPVKVGSDIMAAIKALQDYQKRSAAGRKGGLVSAAAKAARRANQ